MNIFSMAGPICAALLTVVLTQSPSLAEVKSRNSKCTIERGLYLVTVGGCNDCHSPNYAKLTDEDLKAMFAYLKSLKPVRNAVPASVPARAAGTLIK